MNKKKNLIVQKANKALASHKEHGSDQLKSDGLLFHNDFVINDFLPLLRVYFILVK